MLTHVVVFRFETQAHAQEVRAKLLSMRGRVTGLRGLECGVDVTRSERSFDLALITRHDDPAALAAYREDPLHREVLAFIGARATVVHAVDFVNGPETPH